MATNMRELMELLMEQPDRDVLIGLMVSPGENTKKKLLCSKIININKLVFRHELNNVIH